MGLLCLCVLMHSLNAEVTNSALHTQEHVEEGQFYTSHPAQVKVIKTDYRHQSSKPETLLRVTMETIVPDRIGFRRRNLFFAQQYVSDYIEAIDQYLRLSESGQSGNRERVELAKISSWETFQGQRELVFSMVTANSNQMGGAEVGLPLLCISLGYDMENRGGAFYFTPADARELLSLLFDFMAEV